MKERVMKVSGVFLVALGIASADSEKLWIPMMIVTAGMLILWRWSRQF